VVGFTGGNRRRDRPAFYRRLTFAAGASSRSQAFDDTSWQRNGYAVFTNLDENTSLRPHHQRQQPGQLLLPPPEAELTHALHRLLPLWVTNKSGNPADGMTSIFQNSR
jgi:hypothetical protein